MPIIVEHILITIAAPIISGKTYRTKKNDPQLWPKIQFQKKSPMVHGTIRAPGPQGTCRSSRTEESAIQDREKSSRACVHVYKYNIYIYIYIFTHIYIYTYIYIYVNKYKNMYCINKYI